MLIDINGTLVNSGFIVTVRTEAEGNYVKKLAIRMANGEELVYDGRLAAALHESISKGIVAYATEAGVRMVQRQAQPGIVLAKPGIN